MRGGHEGQSHKEMTCDKGNKGWSDMLLKMEEGATSQRTWADYRNQKKQGNSLP